MFINIRLLGGILTIALVLNTCTAEVFTALAEMEELLDTEAVLIANLISYVDAQEEKLSYLRRWVQVGIELLMSSAELNFTHFSNYSGEFVNIKENTAKHQPTYQRIWRIQSMHICWRNDWQVIGKRLKMWWRKMLEVVSVFSHSNDSFLFLSLTFIRLIAFEQISWKMSQITEMCWNSRPTRTWMVLP